METEISSTHSDTLGVSFGCLAGRAGPGIGRKADGHPHNRMLFEMWPEGLNRIGHFISHLKGCQSHPDALKIHSILS